MSNNTRRRFTFLTEVQGTTLVEQVEAADLAESVRRWYAVSAARPDRNDAVAYELDNPVSVQDVSLVWCLSGRTTSGQDFLAHIVETAS